MKTIDEALWDKAEVIREGSSLRTANEQCEIFIQDACALLNLTAPPHDADNEDYDILLDDVSEYTGKLSEAGYTTVWNDGYVIYKDLTEEESKYLSENQY
jgi:hypothetical protein